MYDTLMRLPLLGWALFIAAIQIMGLVRHISIMNMAPTDFGYATHILMRLSVIAFLLLIAAAVILRSRPSTKASGLEPRISALLGTFIIYGITLFPRRDLSTLAEMIATLFTFIGSVGAIVALSQLGRSFSMMAETRQLVTSGPYRFVRHPLYLTEGIAIFGLFIQFASVWTALVLTVQVAFQLRRMHNEETVLTASFPEYAVYRRNTACLVPGIY